MRIILKGGICILSFFQGANTFLANFESLLFYFATLEGRLRRYLLYGADSMLLRVRQGVVVCNCHQLQYFLMLIYNVAAAC